MVQLHFKLRISTSWGDTALIVGSHSAFGAWDTKRAPRLVTSEATYPEWSAVVQVHVPTDARRQMLEYKLAIVSQQGHVTWEPIKQNRRLRVDGHLASAALTGAWGEAIDVCFNETPPPGASASPAAAANGLAPHPTVIAEQRIARPPPMAPRAHRPAPPQAPVYAAGSAIATSTLLDAKAGSIDVPMAAVHQPVPVGAPLPYGSTPWQATWFSPLESIPSMDASWPPSIAASRETSKRSIDAALEELGAADFLRKNSCASLDSFDPMRTNKLARSTDASTTSLLEPVSGLVAQCLERVHDIMR